MSDTTATPSPGASSGLRGQSAGETALCTVGQTGSGLDKLMTEIVNTHRVWNRRISTGRLNRWLEQLHENFIAHVKERRGGKLADNDELFTGEIWIGERAVEVGLADGIGHLVPMMKDRFGDKVKFRRYEQKKPFLARFGSQIAQDALSGIEERAEFARFGL